MERPTLAILAVMLMLGLARCEDYSRFLVDIVEPTGVADVQKTMATVNSILQETDGVDFIFKVVGEPRVLANLTSEEYKDEIRDNLESGLNYRLANHQDLVYRVLGQFPIQMLYFASLKPEEAELVVWHFNRRKLIFTTTVALVQNLDDYLNDCQ